MNRTAVNRRHRTSRVIPVTTDGTIMSSAIAVTNQAGRIYQGPGLVPRSLSIILLICVIVLFHGARISYRISTTHDTRHSNHKTQQPNGILQGHRDRRRSEHHRPSSIVRNKGWYPIEIERNNNTNIGKQQQASATGTHVTRAYGHRRRKLLFGIT